MATTTTTTSTTPMPMTPEALLQGDLVPYDEANADKRRAHRKVHHRIGDG